MKANLKTWSITENNTCSLYKQKSKTQHHNCPTVAVEGHYTYRHKSMLSTIANYMPLMGHSNAKVYKDSIEGYPSPGKLFTLS